MTRIDSLHQLLAGPAARLLALSYISDIELAIARWQMQSDATAVADLYSRLRRLHVVLRAYASELNGSVARKHVRQLARLARRVYAALLANAALTMLKTERLETEKAEAERGMEEVAGKFDRLGERWKRNLAVYKLKLDPDDLPVFELFAAVELRQVTRAANQLQEKLDAWSEQDADGILVIKRAAERLQHLLEPMRRISSAVTDAGRALSQLDALLLSIHAADAVAAALAPESAEPIPQRRERLVVDLQRMWLEGNSKWFFQRLRQISGTTSRMEAVR